MKFTRNSLFLLKKNYFLCAVINQKKFLMFKILSAKMLSA